ncbi:MAG TPA: hypothetical protein VJ717_05075, partial [Gemmatimonadaceae bacterium]|nr:hypothetical protein [Gemmatimonadaceae bacterium]
VPGDRRVKLVGLTARGAKARQAIMEAMHEPPIEVLALDREDLAALAKILAKIPLLAEPISLASSLPAPVAAANPAKRPSPRRSRRPAQRS